MAKSGAVWGIDIGQCALKALRCRPHEKEAGRLVVEAFDYIEYPKILSQPEADRDALVQEALEQFLSRNDLRNDSVAISVPGQSGLARFIKLPPVEKKKIPDIVKYEARQQIPFALEDVVWDYQPLASGDEDEGYALDTAVGLFAMKRDQITRTLRPLDEAGIDVDCVQLSPLCIYNFVCFDRLDNLASAGTFDPDDPPPSTIVISLGTDTTDLVITNGFRVWQRNIPIGGNHFTKALSKELRLTFSKAEHLKRHAMKAEDPKAVFQAMRPVFSDLVAEIQRSLGFFTSNNRKSKLGHAVVVGNAIKLPGLQRYLVQNLDQEVTPVTEFKNLAMGSATATPQFKENLLSFGVAYGLCVQGLGRAQLSTNLLPEEIITTRLVRQKKPWAVVAAALLLIGTTINYASHHASWKSADIETDPAMEQALTASANLAQTAGQFESENAALIEKFNTITQIGANLQSNVDGRLLWLELLKAVDTSLPKDARPEEERQQTAEDVMTRPELHIESFECEYFDDLSPWFAGVSKLYQESQQEFPDLDAEPADAPAAGGAAQPADGEAAAADNTAANDTAANDTAVEENAAADTVAAEDFGAEGSFGGEEDFAGEAATVEGGPTGEGWVIQLTGHHFHNMDRHNESEQFVKNTLIQNLEEGTVMLPDGPGGEVIEVPIADLGIAFPVVVTQFPIIEVTYAPDAVDPTQARRRPRLPPPTTTRRGRSTEVVAEEEEPELWKLRRYDFVVQFCWQPITRSERQAKASGEATADGDDTFDTAESGEFTRR